MASPPPSFPPMAPKAPNGANTDAFATPLADSPTGAASRANAEQQPTAEQLAEFIARKELEDQTRAAAEQARQAETADDAEDAEDAEDADDAEDVVDLLAHARAAQGRGHGIAQAQGNVRYMAPKSITDCAAFYPVLVYKAVTGWNRAHALVFVCMCFIFWIVYMIASALPHWLLAIVTAVYLGETKFRPTFRAINEA